MEKKNCFGLGLSFPVIWLLTSCFEVAAQENYLMMTSRELSAGSQIGEEIYQMYKYYDRKKKAMEIANWTLSQAEHHVDQQCPSQQYCCLNDLYLDCLQCCQGPRPASSKLVYSPSPSPLPSPSSKLFSSINAWKFFLFMFIVRCIF